MPKLSPTPAAPGSPSVRWPLRVALALAFMMSWSATATAAKKKRKKRDKVAIFAFEGHSLPSAIEFAPLGLAKVVSERLRVAGYAVIEPVLLLSDMTVAVDCGEMGGSCAKRIGDNLEVDAIVVGSMETAGARIRVTIRMWGVSGDETPLSEVDALLLPTVKEIAGSFVPLARKLLRPDSRAGPKPEPEPGLDPEPEPPGSVFPPPAVEPISTPTERPGKRGLRSLLPGIALVAAGGVVVALSAVTGVRTLALRRELNDSPLDSVADFEVVVPTRNRGNAFGAATVALWAAGAVCLGAGVTLMLVRPGRSGDAPSVAVMVGGDGPQVLVSVPFGGAAP